MLLFHYRKLESYVLIDINIIALKVYGFKKLTEFTWSTFVHEEGFYEVFVMKKIKKRIALHSDSLPSKFLKKP